MVISKTEDKVVWKFTVDITDDQTVQIPKGSVFLGTVLENPNRLQLDLYAAVPDPDAERVTAGVYIRGTGNPLNLPDGTRYLGSVRNGPFVWHVWCR